VVTVEPVNNTDQTNKQLGERNIIGMSESGSDSDYASDEAQRGNSDDAELKVPPPRRLPPARAKSTLPFDWDMVFKQRLQMCNFELKCANVQRLQEFAHLKPLFEHHVPVN
jgi:hypothetical protein